MVNVKYLVWWLAHGRYLIDGRLWAEYGGYGGNRCINWKLRDWSSHSRTAASCITLEEILSPLWTLLCLLIGQQSWMTLGVSTLFPVETLGSAKFLRLNRTKQTLLPASLPNREATIWFVWHVGLPEKNLFYEKVSLLLWKNFISRYSKVFQILPHSNILGFRDGLSKDGFIHQVILEEALTFLPHLTSLQEAKGDLQFPRVARHKVLRWGRIMTVNKI